MLHAISHCSQQQIAEITKELKNEQDMVRGFKAAAGGAIMSDKMAEAERLLEQNKRELEVLEVEIISCRYVHVLCFVVVEGLLLIVSYYWVYFVSGVLSLGSHAALQQ